MKSFTVSLESRLTVMAASELSAIEIARQLVQENRALLIPSSVSAGYPYAWEPKKEVSAPQRAGTIQHLNTPGPDMDKVMEVYNNVTETWPPKTDDEVPF